MNSSISDEALAVLRRASSQFDEILYELAKQIAAKRGSIAADGCVEIHVADIRQAVVLCREAVQDVSHQSDDLQTAITPLLDEMAKCLQANPVNGRFSSTKKPANASKS